MTKQEVYSNYKECIQEFYTSMRLYKRDHDKTMMREDWNNYIDGLHRDGCITDYQVNNWSNPF
tara:strand:+ start:90 stop:278 length:189 start_codon:yes stop_codon:yes gene_type:complete